MFMTLFFRRRSFEGIHQLDAVLQAAAKDKDFEEAAEKEEVAAQKVDDIKKNTLP